MAAPRPFEPVLFFCGVIYSDRDRMKRALDLLGERFRPPGPLSPETPFDFTDYYDREMGSPLFRAFVPFEAAEDPSRLAELKLATNAIEKEVAEGASVDRPVNLDPGYLDRFKVVLASCKEGPMRIALSGGVFAEVTLTWRKGEFVPHYLTYPDYRTEAVRRVLAGYRRMLLELRRRGGR
ncbi:MAG: DUF4416 domain-containing protein [Planctomycetota bacterium]|nr:MAG: DUF4416 domain-containing protein [Planctomycetota bacterium]